VGDPSRHSGLIEGWQKNRVNTNREKKGKEIVREGLDAREKKGSKTVGGKKRFLGHDKTIEQMHSRKKKSDHGSSAHCFSKTRKKK